MDYPTAQSLICLLPVILSAYYWCGSGIEYLFYKLDIQTIRVEPLLLKVFIFGVAWPGIVAYVICRWLAKTRMVKSAARDVWELVRW